MRALIVVPVWRRARRLFLTVQSWQEDDPTVQILAVVSPDDPDLALHRRSLHLLDVDYTIEEPNRPLSDKWQSGVDYARRCPGWTHLIVMGSDNPTVDVLKSYDPAAEFQSWSDLYLAEDGGRQVYHWIGYDRRQRDEGIGAGRCFSRDLLEWLDWKIFPPGLDRNIDARQTKVLRDHGVRVQHRPMSGYLFDVKDRHSVTKLSDFRAGSLVAVPTPEEARKYL